MKVFLDMVGCRLNQSEIEAYASQLSQAGHTLVQSPGSADLVIINTCTVTAAAASDSRQKIRQAARADAKKIVVTGCHSTLNPAEVSSIPGVTQVINNKEKDNLVTLLLGSTKAGNHEINRVPIPGSRLRTRAFIKVQDGCDNYCTYCITRLARGRGHSRSIQEVYADIHSALNGGAKEAVLTGVHLGSWGFDLAENQSLKDLVRGILAETEIPRLHLSSIEPWDITPDFFELWQDNRLCRHLHLPVQSGSGATLKRMGRKITPIAFADLLHEARTAIPGVSITTDIITGFPGESELEFEESLNFVKEMQFAQGHVFTFSPRPGTTAAVMDNHIPSRIAKQRNSLMRRALDQSSREFRQHQIGQAFTVLWEKATPSADQGWLVSGLTDNYLRVQSFSPYPLHNEISRVQISGTERNCLVGEHVA